MKDESSKHEYWVQITGITSENEYRKHEYLFLVSSYAPFLISVQERHLRCSNLIFCAGNNLLEEQRKETTVLGTKGECNWGSSDRDGCTKKVHEEGPCVCGTGRSVCGSGRSACVGAPKELGGMPQRPARTRRCRGWGDSAGRGQGERPGLSARIGHGADQEGVVVLGQGVDWWS